MSCPTSPRLHLSVRGRTYLIYHKTRLNSLLIVTDFSGYETFSISWRNFPLYTKQSRNITYNNALHENTWFQPILECDREQLILSATESAAIIMDKTKGATEVIAPPPIPRWPRNNGYVLHLVVSYFNSNLKNHYGENVLRVWGHCVVSYKIRGRVSDQLYCSIGGVTLDH